MHVTKKKEQAVVFHVTRGIRARANKKENFTTIKMLKKKYR
jgi:hypothetical protein